MIKYFLHTVNYTTFSLYPIKNIENKFKNINFKNNNGTNIAISLHHNSISKFCHELRFPFLYLLFFFFVCFLWHFLALKMFKNNMEKEDNEVCQLFFNLYLSPSTFPWLLTPVRDPAAKSIPYS